MKKTKMLSTFAAGFVALSVLFASACSDDSESDSSNSTEAPSSGEDGTTTLKIEENGSGFLATTGSINTSDTKWIGFSGGYVESLTSGKAVVYTVKAESAITDAKIALHYANWQNTNVRGAYVSVNGTLVNENKPISMTYTNKGTQGVVVEDRWIDTGYLTGVSLNEGNNTIMVYGAPAATYSNFVPTEKDTENGLTSLEVNNDGQLSNIDYLIVNGKGIDYGTDTTKYYAFSLVSENDEAGTVTSDASVLTMAEGTVVNLSATANDGWTFQCWSDGSSENPYAKTVSESSEISAHFVPSNYEAPTAEEGYVGYATVTSDAAVAYTITGGAGGKTIEIDSLDDLTSNSSKLSGSTPYIVKFTNAERITTDSNASIIMSIGSNKTVYGAVTGAGLKNIEMRVSGKNVIIRNLVLGEVIAYDTYKGKGNDALSLNGATHVWVDHCEFHSNLSPKDNSGDDVPDSGDADFKKDFYDGLLDLKNGASWVTISNCYFHDHWKAFLCGSGDSHDDGDSDMRLTVVDCFFKDINSRQPLFRWGKAHLFNNYFLSEDTEIKGNSNCIDVRVGSAVLAEANYFSGVKNPIGIDLAGSGTNGEEEYSFPDSNELVDCVNTPAAGSSSYTPAYEYTPASASEAKSYVVENAGATLTSLSY